MKEENGILRFKELDDFNNYTKRLQEVERTLSILEEDKKALIKELEELRDGYYYKSPFAALKCSKYWSSDNFKHIARIDKIDGDAYIHYTVSWPEKLDQEYTSSSLGILMRHPVPITEEKYKELYNNIKNELIK